MSNAIEVRSTVMPANEWFLIQQQADELARSDIIPSAYRRKPANIIAAALTGRHWGWDVLTAMRNGHVIEGTWGMKPEAMLGLVRQAGHSVKGEALSDRATLTGKRADNGDELTVTFSIEDAEKAGLCKIVDGKPKARSSTGKVLPWEQYPQSMCYWRAVAMLCRMLFSDVTAGVHSVEELGASINEDGDVVVEAAPPVGRNDEPVPLSEENLARFRQACETEGLEPERVLDEAFGEGVRPEPITDADLPAMRDAFSKLVGEQAQPPEQGDGGESAPPPSSANDELPANRNQVGKIKGEYGRLGITDRLTQLAHSSELLGGIRLSSHNDLTFKQASNLIDILTKKESLG